MIIEKYIESMSTSQICQDIRDLIKDREISYMLVHTRNHYQGSLQFITFSFCIENLKGKQRTLGTVYRYKEECVDETIERLLKSKELSENLHLQPLFDNECGPVNIHEDGIMFISTDAIDHITHRDDDEYVHATVYFKNCANMVLYGSEMSFLEKILEESGRYDLLV